MLLHGNSLIVYGGTGYPFGSTTGDSIHICNLKTLEWKKLETIGDPLIGLYGSVRTIITSTLISSVRKYNLFTLHVSEYGPMGKFFVYFIWYYIGRIL